MNILKNILALFLCIFSVAALAQKQSIGKNQLAGGNINTITTAVPFLTISPDSRAGAMGDAGVASSPDVNSLHWNASKYAFIEKNMGFSLNYTPWLKNLVPGINLAYLSGYKKVGKQQVIAGAMRYFSLGEIQFTDEQGASMGQFTPSEYSFDLAYSRVLSQNFSAGVVMRYIYSNLTGGLQIGSTASRPGRSVAADASATYRKPKVDLGSKKGTLSFGINISNIGAKISYTDQTRRDFLPTNLRLGSGLTVNLDDYNSIAFVLDINKLLIPSPPVKDYSTNPATITSGLDNNVGVVTGMLQSFYDAPGGSKEEVKEMIYCGGFEYWYDKLFAFRTGFFFEDKTKGNRQYVSFGAGLRYNVFGLDLAYLAPINGQQSPLQNTLRFTLTFDFDAFKSQNNGPAEGGE